MNVQGCFLFTMFKFTHFYTQISLLITRKDPWKISYLKGISKRFYEKLYLLSELKLNLHWKLKFITTWDFNLKFSPAFGNPHYRLLFFLIILILPITLRRKRKFSPKIWIFLEFSQFFICPIIAILSCSQSFSRDSLIDHNQHIHSFNVCRQVENPLKGSMP